MFPLGELTVADAHKISGRDVPSDLNLRNRKGYAKAVVSVLIKQRRRHHNVVSAVRHRNKAKLIAAGLKATIESMAGEIRSLKALLPTRACTACHSMELRLSAARVALQNVGTVYDCSPFVLNPQFLLD
jgi:hypothetical protein